MGDARGGEEGRVFDPAGKRPERDSLVGVRVSARSHSADPMMNQSANGGYSTRGSSLLAIGVRRRTCIRSQFIHKIAVALVLVLAVAVPGWGRSASDRWEPASSYLTGRRPVYEGIVRSSFYLTMRDGVKIAIDLNLPKGLKEDEKIPTIIRQTRYYRSHELGPLLRFLKGAAR